MKIQWVMSKKYFCVIFLFILLCEKNIFTEQVSQLVNVINALQAIKQNASVANNNAKSVSSGSGQLTSSAATLTPPSTPIAASTPFGTWGATPTDTFVATGNTLASNMATLVDPRQNGTAIACKGGLQSINIGLVGSTGQGGWGCGFNIAASPTLQKLAQQGMYVVVTTYQQSGTNFAIASLTDVSGNVFALASTTIPAGQGFSWVNIGYNKNDTFNILKPNQVYVNWIPVTANKVIASWYQDQGSATIASVPVGSIGGQAVPTTPPASTSATTLTPPATPIAATTPFGTWGATPTDAFVATGNTLASNMATLVDPRQNGTAIACQGGLQTINVGLVGSTGQGGWGCGFNIAASPTLQKLAQQGMYVVVTTYQQSGTNFAIASLTDVSGNVFATASTTIPAGQGFSWVNIGYNKNDTFNALKPNQVYVNWIPVTANKVIASWYQDQGSATTVSTSSIPVVTTGVNSQTTPPVLTSTTTLTPPATPIAATVPFAWGGGNLPSDPIVATSSTSLGSWPVASIQNNTAISCSGGLQYLYVTLTNQAATAWTSCQFTIQGNATLTSLAQQGLYVATQISNVNTTANTSTITISLTDVSGNVYAQTSYNTPSGYGVTYMLVGANMHPRTATSSTPPVGQAYVNWVPIASSQRVYYQQSTINSASFGGITPPVVQTTTTTGTTTSTGSGTTTTSTGSGTTTTSGSTSITPLILASTNINNACSFETPGLEDLTSSVSNVLSPTPFSCQGGLTEINIGLTDSTGCYLSFNFDATILNQPAIQTLIQNGMYIGVNTIASSNSVVAVLMDQNNTVYAQGTAQLPSGTGGKIQSWNLGLNTSDSNVVNGSTQLGFNDIGIITPVLYKQLSTVSQPVGAVQPPSTPPSAGSGWAPFSEE